MKKKILFPAFFVSLILLLLNFKLAFAHQTITVGDYQVEIGWVSEPPIAGQMNAVVVNVNDGSGNPVEDVSNLVIKVVYADQSKTLTLQPLGENTPGQYVAPMLPTIPGQYTIKLSGKLGSTDVSGEVNPEKVDVPDTVQFPLASNSSQSTGLGLTGWLAILGILFGLAGTGFGLAALQKKS